MKFTPEQQIKKCLVIKAIDSMDDKERARYKDVDFETQESPEDFEEIYEDLRDIIQDIEYDFRSGTDYTGLTTEGYSRNFEYDEVACKCCGVWVGWTYWHGGGKHSEPEAIDWKKDAYFIDCVEEEVVAIKQTFSRI